MKGKIANTQEPRRCGHFYLFLLLAASFSCSPGEDTARGVAEHFLDEHYVHINLQASKAYCTGLALHKINEEIRLTEGQVIDESTRKPRVHYALMEHKEGEGNTASFLYQATISVEDAGKFTKKWLLTLRKQDRVWRISNYQEFDPEDQ